MEHPLFAQLEEIVKQLTNILNNLLHSLTRWFERYWGVIETLVVAYRERERVMLQLGLRDSREYYADAVFIYRN